MTDAKFKQRLAWSLVSIFLLVGAVLVASLLLGYGDPVQLESWVLGWTGIFLFMMGSFLGHSGVGARKAGGGA